MRGQKNNPQTEKHCLAVSQMLPPSRPLDTLCMAMSWKCSYMNKDPKEIINCQPWTKFHQKLFTNCLPRWQKSKDTVRRYFVPMANCPTSIFRATNCPRWQNVPLSPHATNCPSDKMSHFLSGDKMSHWWSYWKPIVSLAFFRRQIVPRWQNVPLSPRRQNVPTYALMHRKVLESCWDILSVVPLCQFEGQYLGQRLRISRAYIGYI